MHVPVVCLVCEALKLLLHYIQGKQEEGGCVALGSEGPAGN